MQTRRACRSDRTPVLLGLLLLIVACGVGRAAAPVVPDPRPVHVEPYNAAAARFGWTEWGLGEDGRRVVHVFYRISPLGESLSICLPPSVPQAKAAAWLTSLADALGWTRAELSVTRAPGGSVVRALRRGGLRAAGLGASQVGLDLALLQRQVARVTPAPILLGIRMTADLRVAQPAPLYQGAVGGETFLFYRLGPAGSPAAAPLRLEFGLSPRRLMALVSVLLLWLVFPPIVFFVLREHLRAQGERDGERGRDGQAAMDRLATYRRWQRGVGRACSFGSFGTYLLLFSGRSGVLGLAPLLLLYLLPSSVSNLSARLIGFPLEVAASPERAALPWYRRAGSEVGGFAVLLAVLSTMGYWLYPLQGGRLPDPAGLLLIPLILLMILIALGAAIPLWFMVRTYLRKKLAAPGAPAPPAGHPAVDTEAVRGELEELARRLAVPVPALKISQLAGASASALPGFVAVSREIGERLSAKQVAALIMAAELARPKTAARRAAAGFGMVPLLLLLCVIFSLYLSLRSGVRPSASPWSSWVLPLLILCWIPGSAVVKVQQRQQENADVRVAEALDDPRLFLDALRRLEELAQVTGEVYSITRNSPLAQRRLRLERRLRMD